MFYIITYATHSERYFDILNKYPEIIVLGWNTKWNGFFDKANAVIDFCKSKNQDDVVCFVDGFDSIILSSSTQLLETYKSLNKELVFSREASYFNVIHKYLLDKIFSRCQNVTLNSGMYIGTCKSIIDFWTDIKVNEDDQVYANRICKIKNVYIDKDYRLFYNYSSPDKITIKNKQLYIFDNDYSSCVISSPGSQNINHLLSELGYIDLPVINYNLYYRIKTYYKHFIFEICFFILLIILYFFFPKKSIFIILCILFFFLLLHYQIYTKHLDLPFYNKMIYTAIDFIHLSIFAIILYLIFHFECTIFKLLLLNCFYFFILIMFFIIKYIFFILIENKILNGNNSIVGIKDRILYIFNKNYEYKKTIDYPLYDFMEVNQFFVFLLFFINFICLIKIGSSKCELENRSKNRSKSRSKSRFYKK